MRATRRALRALLLTGVLLGSAILFIAPGTVSFSDGVAGGTAQIPEHLRQCAEGFEFCKVRTGMCGGCHGTIEDMRRQLETEDHEQANIAVTDRIGARVVVSGNPAFWEYDPGQLYLIEVSIRFKNGFDNPNDPGHPTNPGRGADARPPGFGEYSDGAFALNASTGRLERLPGDNTVRITGGLYEQYGSRNPELHYECPAGHPKHPGTCRYGNVESDETGVKSGEAVNTYQGSQERLWNVRWRAPSVSEPPYGVAFQATVMVPTGEGWDACVHVQCNQSMGYSDQGTWDWWTNVLEGTQSASVPRAIIACQRGAYETPQACREAVLAHVLPPTPPPRTNGPGNGDDGRIPGTPLHPMDGALALAVAAMLSLAVRRRRGSGPHDTVY